MLLTFRNGKSREFTRPVIVKAVQDPASLSNTFKQTLIAWLADAQNGITDFFAKVGHFNQLCAVKPDGSQVCLTNDQFVALVSAAANGNLPISVPSSPSNPRDTGGSDLTNSEQPPHENSTTTPTDSQRQSPTWRSILNIASREFLIACYPLKGMV